MGSTLSKRGHHDLLSRQPHVVRESIFSHLSMEHLHSLCRVSSQMSREVVTFARRRARTGPVLFDLYECFLEGRSDLPRKVDLAHIFLLQSMEKEYAPAFIQLAYFAGMGVMGYPQDTKSCIDYAHLAYRGGCKEEALQVLTHCFYYPTIDTPCWTLIRTHNEEMYENYNRMMKTCVQILYITHPTRRTETYPAFYEIGGEDGLIYVQENNTSQWLPLFHKDIRLGNVSAIMSLVYYLDRKCFSGRFWLTDVLPGRGTTRFLHERQKCQILYHLYHRLITIVENNPIQMWLYGSHLPFWKQRHKCLPKEVPLIGMMKNPDKSLAVLFSSFERCLQRLA